ncbi:hypothetical protein GCM10011490_25720 [Pseudoclavibacter endophyticus]|uniref:Uncharacterized protein n=1 Tax=Pseudoclavibacter endophyticus TaxID=1778590 RepID=A0A6H9WG43_9MICO|nr:hypothetical protein F8O04_12835 [Pseudoclavibacter endophyticus]GGA73697.1 hypothetical protein GCM10011490_25720 [Pseudoclavibacter endophyticus]
MRHFLELPPPRRRLRLPSVRRTLTVAIPCAVLALAAVLALLFVPTPGSASAADYGPGFDNSDNGGNGRIGAYRFEGRNVYCLEPLRDRPIGATNAAGDVGPSELGVPARDLAAVNWAISTYGQSDDPIIASAVAMFVWSIVAADELASAGAGDDGRLVRVPEPFRADVRNTLATLRHEAALVTLAGEASLHGELDVRFDPDDWGTGTVSLTASDAASTATVTIDGAVFVGDGAERAAETVEQPGAPGFGAPGAPSGSPGLGAGDDGAGLTGTGGAGGDDLSGSDLGDGDDAPTGDDAPIGGGSPSGDGSGVTATLRPGESAPFRVEGDRVVGEALTVRATGTLMSETNAWRPALASFETPGAQLLGGEGGTDRPEVEIAGEATLASPTFEPVISTEVESSDLRIGDPFVDLWSAAVPGGAWLRDETGAYAAVTVTGIVYGPFDTMPQRSSDPPANAPVAATLTAVLGGGDADPTTGPVRVSTAELGTPIVAERAGYYVWVVSIESGSQPGTSPLPEGYAWHDDFGVPSEIAHVSPEPEPTPAPTPPPSETTPPATTPAETPSPEPPSAEPDTPAPPIAEPEVPTAPDGGDDESSLAATGGVGDLNWVAIAGVGAVAVGCIIAAAAIKRADARVDRRREAARR